jgi:hypothetical protein
MKAQTCPMFFVCVKYITLGLQSQAEKAAECNPSDYG